MINLAKLLISQRFLESFGEMNDYQTFEIFITSLEMQMATLRPYHALVLGRAAIEEHRLSRVYRSPVLIPLRDLHALYHGKTGQALCQEPTHLGFGMIAHLHHLPRPEGGRG